MTKNHLFRDKAPITEAGWAEIEKEAKRTLRAILAARRVVDFRGPMGWDDSEAEIGRADRPEYTEHKPVIDEYRRSVNGSP